MTIAVDTLAPEQVEAFWRDGFIALPAFLDDESLETLRDLYDQFVSGDIKAGDENGLLGGVTRQIMFPSRYHEYFADNPAVQAGLTIASQLAPGRPEFMFDMLITKPPQHLVDTPWHQDNAYFDMPFTAAGAETNKTRFQFWVALDDVDAENGCMQFIPGMHMQPLLGHHVASDDPTVSSRLLAITNVDESLDMSTVAVCPLHAGGCTIHAMGTPHFTGGNRSTDRPRRAYIFNVGVTEPES